ncbi:MAG: hypothetical protein ABSF18_05020 [Gammaproteobacteria bacterium]|jgi:hypothetical protein
MNNPPNDTKDNIAKEIIKKFQYVSLNKQTDAVTHATLLQQMNYRVSQLPMAPQCPNAPLPPPSMSLPSLIKK